LGLSIAQYVIELHGGRLLIEGVRGRGSTFLVGLPE
jgi:signal transduction histidine kinase